MRRIVEEPETALPHTGGGAFLSLRGRRFAPLFVFTLACYLVSPFLGLDSRTVDPRIAEVWPPGGVGFVLLTLVWFAGRRTLGATLVGMAAVFAATAVALGYATPVALWLALTGVAQPVLMAALYRRRLGHTGWAPESPREVGALLFAAVSSSIALGLVGGYPFRTLDDLTSHVLLWWVLRNTVFCFVGAAAFTVLYHGRRSEVLPTSSWLNRLGLLLTALVCVLGTYHDPSLPLSWLLIVPSVWGGLTLTVRGTAYLALTVALMAAVLTYLPQNQFGYGGVLPAASIVDLLVIASSAFALLLTLMREQRDALITELDRKGAESESQRQMLETVFDSMNEGVVILDDHQKVTMFNAAARQLLGRPITAEHAGSWARTFDLCDAGGAPLDDALVHDTLVGATGSQPHTLEVITGHGNSARILDLTSQPIGRVGDHSTMVLLHDVTAQRTRLRELSNFAGMVAHDLRGPLTVMDGWLEMAQDAETGPSGAVDDAVARARDASKRMRQVIDDWLSYTVVQNGQLRPAAVKLEEVASEIIEGRRANWADGDEPQFVLDLTHSVQADPALLRQLLDNLIGNAIKYTAPDQAPRVEVVSRSDREPGWVRVCVRDHGIGIPEGQEQLIFEEFHRGPVEGRSAGTGLGLALSRRIVALHGGELTAQRNQGPGSTFTFTLPEA